MADDYSSDISTTGRLGVGGSAKGSVDSNGDADWFKITLTAGTSYLFQMTGQLDGGGTLTDFSGSTLMVYNGDSVPLASSWYSPSGGHGPQVGYTADHSGSYYVGALNGYYSLGKTYTLKATLADADDFAGDRSTTGEASAEATLTGAFQLPDDKDWFHFHADAGQVVRFDNGSGAGLSEVSRRTIYNADGQYVTSLQSEPQFVVNKSGEYYLELAASGTVGAYAQTMHVGYDDYSSDDSRAGALYLSGQVSGKLDYQGDVDRFTMDMTAGQVYTLSLSMDADARQLPNLSVSDASGAYRGYYNANVVNGTMTVRFLAASSGTYKLDVGSSYPDFSGKAYTLKALSSEADDHGGTMASATALALGQTVSGVLQSRDDVDMFQIDLDAGVTYNIALPQNDGYNLSGRLTDANGGQAAWTSNYKAFSFTPTVAGTYYLSQSPGYSVNDAQPYSVTVSAAADDYAANTGTTGKLLVGGSTKGELEAGGGDRDWFAVTLNAGGSYWFRVAGNNEGAGTLAAGATVKLYDAQGKLLATEAGGYYSASPVLQYQAATKGTYFVEVSSPNNAGTYQVKAQVAERDDYGSDAAHASPIQEGVTVNGKLELTTDRDVFKLSALQGASYELVLTSATADTLWSSYASVSVSDGASSYTSTRTFYGSDGKTHLMFDAAHAGDYYLTVATSLQGVAGGYALTAKLLGIDDFSANAQTTALVTPDAPLRGALGVPGDQDWIKVHLEAGRSYVFDLQGAQSGGGSLDTGDYATSMVLMGSGGSYLAQSSAAAGEPRIAYLAASTGDYFLSVYNSSSKTGSYTVSETLTSGDASAPVLLSSSLQNGAVNTPLQQKIVLDYSEAIMLGSGYTLKDANGVSVPAGYGTPLFKALGHTLTIDPHIFLKPGMSYTVALPEGAVLDLAGNKAAAQSYTFTTLPAVTAGTAGNDYLVGAAKGLSLDGGAGLDTVYYDGTGSNLSISRDASGKVTVRDYWSGNAGDTLQNVERLLFTDHAVALDVDGVGGQVYRLYQAAFHRAPAASGAGFWMSAMDHGASLTAIADQFVQSPEFARLYGTAASDGDFVKQVFHNVLGRDPLPAGSDFWTGALHDGASRAAVLAAISESTENVAHVAQVIGNGFNYTPWG